MSKPPDCSFRETISKIKQRKSQEQKDRKLKQFSNKIKESNKMGCFKWGLLHYKGTEKLPIIRSSLVDSYKEQEYDRNKNKRCEYETATAVKDISRMKEICEKINCPQMSYQLNKVIMAQHQLMRVQHRDLFDRIFGNDFLCFCSQMDFFKSEMLRTDPFEDYSLKDDNVECENVCIEEDGVVCVGSDNEIINLPPENEWHGYFTGYEILSEKTEFSLDELKKCIEITHTDTVASLEGHLRAGVRCFMIDLFKGNSHRNQTLILRFRQCELNIAKELGFPVTSTLFARISPRLQYTGYLEPSLKCVYLCKNDCLVMTTDRFYASHCCRRKVFVNARYLLSDVHCYDVLLIGPKIQVMVMRVMEDCFRCKVLCGGILHSRMAVLFHRRCHRFRMSFCELEDITFVKEVGINVIVSDIIGTKAYFENLRSSLTLLKCENLRIFACVTINNVEDYESNYNWALDSYDGFLGVISEFSNGCGGDGNVISLDDKETPRILFVNPKINKLIEYAHRMHKPFILDPTPLINHQYVMDPGSYKIVLYHPDKYLFCSDDSVSSSFFMLANALGNKMPVMALNKQLPYCDESHTGSDTLALSTAAASIELDASCIFVAGYTGRMVTKIASFRPKATIFFISSLQSAANFISIHHNVIMLYYNNKMMESNHQKSIYTQFIFAISYAVKLKSLQNCDQVIFVYGQKPGQLFLDKYVTYKFDESNFVRELAQILF